VEKVYTIWQQIYSGNGVPNCVSIAPSFVRDITKKHFGLFFFWTQCMCASKTVQLQFYTVHNDLPHQHHSSPSTDHLDKCTFEH